MLEQLSEGLSLMNSETPLSKLGSAKKLMLKKIDSLIALSWALLGYTKFYIKDC